MGVLGSASYWGALAHHHGLGLGLGPLAQHHMGGLGSACYGGSLAQHHMEGLGSA